MGFFQFALFTPMLLGIFVISVDALKGRDCRSKVVRKVVLKELESTVDKNRVSIPFKFDLGCKFTVSKSKSSYKVLFLKEFQRMEMKFSLPGRLSNE